jgi:hypothetical protein
MNSDKNIFFTYRYLVILLSLIFLAGTALEVCAQEQPVELLEVSPVPPIESEGTIVPIIFNGRGRIDRFDGKKIVVGDRLRRLSSSVLFYTKEGKVISRNLFNVGDMIGYLENKHNEIIAVYKLK